jgi:aspartate-semialdehyde dehydrogenase
MSYNIAIVGATGRVGTEILNILSERKFPVKEVYALASSNSVGKKVSFGFDRILTVESVDDFDFSKVKIVLSSAGADISKKIAKNVTDSGAIIIDNTSYFRTDEEIPLIIPEININDLPKYKNKGIIANPNCSTIQMLLPLYPLHKEYKIKRIVVSTYQSVSGAGLEAMDELFNQTKGIYTNTSKDSKVFPSKIAFNLIPEIDVFQEDGYTKEEWKMSFETNKILDKNIKLSATCVRVPVFIGHSESVNVEFEKDIDINHIYKLLTKAKGINFKGFDDNKDNDYFTSNNKNLYATPLDIVGQDYVSVGRVRLDNTQKNTINLWIVGDNLRKGAALNAVQIAEELIKIL